MMDDLLQEMIDPAPVHRDARPSSSPLDHGGIVGLAAVGATTLTTSAIFTDNDSTSADDPDRHRRPRARRHDAVRLHAARTWPPATRRSSPLHGHEQRLPRAAVLDLLLRAPRGAPGDGTPARRPERRPRAAHVRGRRRALQRRRDRRRDDPINTAGAGRHQLAGQPRRRRSSATRRVGHQDGDRATAARRRHDREALRPGRLPRSRPATSTRTPSVEARPAVQRRADRSTTLTSMSAWSDGQPRRPRRRPTRAARDPVGGVRRRPEADVATALSASRCGRSSSCAGSAYARLAGGPALVPGARPAAAHRDVGLDGAEVRRGRRGRAARDHRRVRPQGRPGHLVLAHRAPTSWSPTGSSRCADPGDRPGRGDRHAWCRSSTPTGSRRCGRTSSPRATPTRTPTSTPPRSGASAASSAGRAPGLGLGAAVGGLARRDAR